PAAGWMSRLCWTPRAARKFAASADSDVDSGGIARDLQRWSDFAGRRIPGEVGLHQVVRLAEKVDLLQRPPAQPPEERHVGALDGGAEAVAPPGPCRAARRLHQAPPDHGGGAKVDVDAEAPAPPVARRRLPDPHHADHARALV